ncbi:translational GTPase TypA [Thermoactinomyces intermedius]|uniref:Large ribosomal subunit assembly factor BipA n=1 Tax=Thermoactinomyces intermedius TaxID=2024 RepID=A0A8I1AAW7_THEIN|nr:translational GTPase TypA [Thermoactinomyces intermedius]MBA4548609.1 translational GTPase TypA [Thermoactinomyces intermedius]MBA4836683.1 translational GTPase TypA [Thermoactinomyces intermedius]MBH8594487.1 translational GTPase TypA [Thermoactinomyces intermedius]
MKPENIRNIAIIAHVDHGKTTLVDAMLRQSHIFRENEQVEERVMDSNDLERERGITILSKNTAIHYKDIKINIVDTPGHADFGGEVERVMNMVDGVLLLVDATEGPMPQTKFVLKKALERGHKAIVVVNKIDRPSARPEEVINQTFDLFIDLGATEEQCDFPIVYASGLTGSSGFAPDALKPTMEPLLDTIIEQLPAPAADPDGPAQMQATLLDYDDYKGQIVIGRLNRGTIQKNQTLALLPQNGEKRTVKAGQVFTHQGLNRMEVQRASAGDIIAITGLGEVGIGDTITDPEHPEPLPPIKVEEPTLRMMIGINTSPFAGQDGEFLTSRKIRERLMRETEKDVALRVEETDSADHFLVSGRGELHLSILIENMRREGYEFQVSKPEVILKEENGIKLEPYEIVEIETSSEQQGAVVELLGKRKGQLQDMVVLDSGNIRFTYKVPSRGLLGFRLQLLTATHGEAMINTMFHGYEPYAGGIEAYDHGSLIAWESGTATTYALHAAQERGQLYITPGTEVYEGMVVGQHIRETDLEVNVCKKKHLTSIRRATAEEALRLDTPRQLSIDDALEIMKEDELLEITPKTFRLRKKLLKKNERDRARKHKQ